MPSRDSVMARWNTPALAASSERYRRSSLGGAPTAPLPTSPKGEAILPLKEALSRQARVSSLHPTALSLQSRVPSLHPRVPSLHPLRGIATIPHPLRPIPESNIPLAAMPPPLWGRSGEGLLGRPGEGLLGRSGWGLVPPSFTIVLVVA